MSDSDAVLAWHFSNGTLSHGDGRTIMTGMALACSADKIKICENGFHASVRIIDALNNSREMMTILSRVECGGKIIYSKQNDKLVCSQRRHVAVIDVGRMFYEFANVEPTSSYEECTDIREMMFIAAQHVAKSTMSSWSGAVISNWFTALAVAQDEQSKKLEEIVLAQIALGEKK